MMLILFLLDSAILDSKLGPNEARKHKNIH